MLLAMDWATFFAGLTTASVAIIGAIAAAAVLILNALHANRVDAALQHDATKIALEGIQKTVNGNTQRLIDKIPEPPKQADPLP